MCLPGTRPNISESHSETRNRVPFCITQTLPRVSLLAGHAYSIMHVVECEGVCLLQLRNPWGQHEWKGAWAASSDDWNRFVPSHGDRY